jgi:hypothetical protein
MFLFLVVSEYSMVEEVPVEEASTEIERFLLRLGRKCVELDKLLMSEVDKEFEDFCLKHSEELQVDCTELARAIGYLLFTLEKNGLCKVVNDVVMN